MTIKNNNEKDNKPIYIITVLAIVCVVLLCLFLTKKPKPITVTLQDGQTISYPVEEAQRYMETYISSARSFIKKDHFADKKIYVIGHKSPDLDTVGCAIAYADLIKKLGYDAEPRITMAPDAETRFALEYCEIPTPEILTDAENQNIILVDVSDPVNAIDNMDKANVIGIIDHHGSTLNTPRPIVFEVEPTGAAETIVGMSFMKYGIVPDPTIAKLMAVTILSDTSGFTNNDTTYADQQIFDWVAGISGVTKDEIMPKLLDARTGYYNMTDKEIFYNDTKTYKAGNDEYVFLIAAVAVKTKDEIKDMAHRLKKVMEAEYPKSDYDMMMLQVYDLDHSANWIAVVGQDTNYIIDNALKDELTWVEEEGMYYGEPSNSRKTVYAPKISEFVLK